MSVKSFAEAVTEGVTRYTRKFGIEEAEAEEAEFASDLLLGINDSLGSGSAPEWVGVGIVGDRSGALDKVYTVEPATLVTAVGLSLAAGCVPLPIINITNATLLSTVSPTAYAEGAVALIKAVVEAHPTVTVFEVVNEPYFCGPHKLSNAADYANIVAKTYELVAAAGLKVTLLVAATGEYEEVNAEGVGTGKYRDWITDLGTTHPSLKALINGWTSHPYGKATGPSNSESSANLTAMSEMHAKAVALGFSGTNNWWATEMGWQIGGSGAPGVATQAQQAEELRKALVRCSTWSQEGWLRAVFVYDTDDGGWGILGRLAETVYTNSGATGVGEANGNPLASRNQSFITGMSAPTCVATDTVANAPHVYWGTKETNNIGCAGIDGTEVNQTLITGCGRPHGILVHEGFIYWVEETTNTVGRATLTIEGTKPAVSGINHSFITGCNAPKGIGFNAGHLFWTNHGNGTIGRATLAGTEVNQAFISGCEGPQGTVTFIEEHMFWGEQTHNSIARATSAGGSVEHEYVKGCNNPVMGGTDGEWIYWSNFGANAVARARPNNTEVDQTLIAGFNGPQEACPDSTGHLWTANQTGNTIGRVTLGLLGTAALTQVPVEVGRSAAMVAGGVTIAAPGVTATGAIIITTESATPIGASVSERTVGTGFKVKATATSTAVVNWAVYA